MPHISIRPGDPLTVAEDITIQFDKFDFIDGCSRMDIYDAYDELSVVRGPGPESTGEEMRDRLQKLARDIVSGLSALEPVQSKALLDSFVSELFLLVAEQRQREARRQKQAKGIAVAKAKGVRFGPKPGTMPDGFEELRQAWRSKKISLSMAAEFCGVPRSTFYDAALRAEMAAEAD